MPWKAALTLAILAVLLRWSLRPTLKLQRVHLTTSSTHPDTTAVVLNWSRLANVVEIAALLCGPTLNSTIAKVFVWNNSPRKVSHRVGHIFVM